RSPSCMTPAKHVTIYKMLRPIALRSTGRTGPHPSGLRRPRRTNALGLAQQARPAVVLVQDAAERFFNKIEQCRRIATPYDKLVADCLAFVKLASIRLWHAPM